MPTFEHKKIIEQLTALDKLPTKQEELVAWVKAGSQNPGQITSIL